MLKRIKIYKENIVGQYELYHLMNDEEEMFELDPEN
jgi:hypothetical protein